MAEIKTRRKALLVLATGRVFEGWGFGARPEEAPAKGSGEVVFNTSLTGYQEILTDPSYTGQIVAMTASHIGNYGVNEQDVESSRLYLSGFVIQELSRRPSNWRSTMTLDDYLAKAGVPGISGVDTRSLTRHLRSQGAVNGLIASATADVDALVKRAKKIPGLEGRDLAGQVTAKKPFDWTEGEGQWLAQKDNGRPKKKVVVIDFGVKHNILRCLVDLNCDVSVVPATTPAKDILALRPDGILVSNGPGDPSAVSYGINTLQDLISDNLNRTKKGDRNFALFGICLGHQLLGLALGGKTYKLKFGHHGANHPVKDLETGQVDITTQNHGFGVEGEQKSGEWIVKGNPDALVTHLNLNDHAVEGLRHRTLPVFSVQYHPEAAAGPHDAHHLFDRFMKAMEKGSH